jgi:hypothetical protein
VRRESHTVAFHIVGHPAGVALERGALEERDRKRDIAAEGVPSLAPNLTQLQRVTEREAFVSIVDRQPQDRGAIKI